MAQRDPLRAPSEKLRVELSASAGEAKLNKAERELRAFLELHPGSHNLKDLEDTVNGASLAARSLARKAIVTLKQVRDPINEVRGWLAASYAQAGRLQEARTVLEEFLHVAESDMAVFPGRKLKDWVSFWHGTFEYQDQKDFDHLFDGLRKAGLPE